MRIIIVGGGKLGNSLAQRLVEEGHDITVVDSSDAVVQRGMDTLDALFIKGSGVSADILTEADVQHADIVIAATAGDEVNMLACLTAKRLGAQYAIARIRDPEYLSSLPFLQKELDIDYVINPERSTAREISRMLRFPFAGNIETFARGRVEMVDFRAAEGDLVVGVPLAELYKKNHALPHVLFGVVERGSEAVIPRGDFVIQPGDRVHVVGDVKTITAFFEALGRGMADIRQRERVKSISFASGKLCWIWCEEATKFEQEDVEILDDRLRGVLPNENLYYQITLSFNPVSSAHWIKRRFFDAPSDNTIIQFSAIPPIGIIGFAMRRTPGAWKIESCMIRKAIAFTARAIGARRAA